MVTSGLYEICSPGGVHVFPVWRQEDKREKTEIVTILDIGALVLVTGAASNFPTTTTMYTVVLVNGQLHEIRVDDLTSSSMCEVRL